MLVVATGGEGDLGQSEVILGARQRGVQHQHVALEQRGEGGGEIYKTTLGRFLANELCTICGFRAIHSTVWTQ